MILIRRGLAVFLYFLFTAAILSIGIFAYLELNDDLKTTAETILYISVAGAAVILVAFIFVSWRTLSLYQELDKLIELNKVGDFSPELSMKKLGGIGERITLLYYSLNSLNDKKTLKISAISSLVDFLFDNIEIPLLATDVQGFICYLSRSLTERVDRPRSEIISRNIEEVVPDVSYRDQVLELDKSKTPIELKDLKTPLTLVGIRNRRNELSYVVWMFGGTPHLPEVLSGSGRAKPKSDRLARIFRRRSR